LRETGELAGGSEYPAVNAAIARFEKRLTIDRELQKKLKRVAKTLRIDNLSFDVLERAQGYGYVRLPIGTYQLQMYQSRLGGVLPSLLDNGNRR
jgi:hypothetical protein